MSLRRSYLAVLLVCASVAMAGEPKSGAPLGAIVSAKSALVLDAVSGKVLWSRNPDVRRFPASTTKILTTLLLLESGKPEAMVVAPLDVEQIEESSLHLLPGERVSVLDLAYAVMLRSANDGAYAAAVHVSGSVEAFSQLMNDRAEAIGCTGTQFRNPNGLPDKEHWTTAHDLGLIAREAMQNELFRKIAATRKYQVTRDLNQEDTWMISKNNLLAADDATEGIKTGYTRAAGHCFVGSASKAGFRVITVILGSEDWRSDHKAMANWAFENFELKAIRKAGDSVGEAAIAGGDPKTVTALLKEDVLWPVPKGSEPVLSTEFQPHDSFQFPIAKGTEIGLAVIKDDSGWAMQVSAVAADDVQRATLLAGARKAPWSFYLVACMLGASAYVVRKRALRMASGVRRR